MTIKEQLQIVEENLNEYGQCNITLEEFEYLKNQIRAEVIEELKLLVIKNHCDEIHCHYCDDKPISPKNCMCVLRDLE